MSREEQTLSELEKKILLIFGKLIPKKFTFINRYTCKMKSVLLVIMLA